MVLLYCALFSVVPSFVIISLEKRELVALLKYNFFVKFDCYCPVSLPQGAVAWSEVWHFLVILTFSCDFAQFNFKNPHCKYHQQISAVS